MAHSNETLSQVLDRLRHKHGDAFSVPDVTYDQVRYFNGPRVEVTTTYPSGETYVRRGRISITCGTAPSLMLMHRTSDSGSSDLINKDDEITALIVDGNRIPVNPTRRPA